MVQTILEIESRSEFIHNNIYKFSSYVRGSVLRVSYIKFCLILKTTIGSKDLSVAAMGWGSGPMGKGG